MIRKQMEALRGSLNWKFETRKHDEDAIAVTCDPIRQRHTVFSPQGRRIRDRELMEAVCHAVLAEEVHPLFSAVIAESGDMLPEKVFQSQVWPVLCITRRWFSDARFLTLCPVEFRQGVALQLEEFDAVHSGGEVSGDVATFLHAALILAEADDFCGVHRKVSGRLREMVSAFRRIDPVRPTLRKLQTLNNGLLRTYCPFRVEPVANEEVGTDLWRVE